MYQRSTRRWCSQSAIGIVPILLGPCWSLLLSSGLSSVNLQQLSEESVWLCVHAIMVIQSCGYFQFLSSKISPGTLFCENWRKRLQPSCNFSQLHLPAALVLTQALLAWQRPYFCMDETPSSVYLRPSIQLYCMQATVQRWWVLELLMLQICCTISCLHQYCLIVRGCFGDRCCGLQFLSLFAQAGPLVLSNYQLAP